MPADRASPLVPEGPSGARPAWDLRWVDTIDSTNRALVEEARQGAPTGTVLVADVQTAGRGRLGRRWEAPPGSALLVSVLLRPTGLEPDDLHLITQAASCSLAGAVEALTVAAPRPLVARLKWPNDVLAGGRKLAGILAESLADASGVSAVVVGVGCNVDWGPVGPPPELAAIATSIAEQTGAVVARTELLSTFLDGLGRRFEAIHEPSGRATLRAEYGRRLATIGQRVRVELPGGVLEGEAVDVDECGRLVVVLAGGERRAVAVGDVVHVRPAGA